MNQIQIAIRLQATATRGCTLELTPPTAASLPQCLPGWGASHMREVCSLHTLATDACLPPAHTSTHMHRRADTSVQKTHVHIDTKYTHTQSWSYHRARAHDSGCWDQGCPLALCLLPGAKAQATLATEAEAKCQLCPYISTIFVHHGSQSVHRFHLVMEVSSHPMTRPLSLGTPSLKMGYN